MAYKVNDKEFRDAEAAVRKNSGGRISYKPTPVQVFSKRYRSAPKQDRAGIAMGDTDQFVSMLAEKGYRAPDILKAIKTANEKLDAETKRKNTPEKKKPNWFEKRLKDTVNVLDDVTDTVGDAPIPLTGGQIKIHDVAEPIAKAGGKSALAAIDIISRPVYGVSNTEKYLYDTNGKKVETHDNIQQMMKDPMSLFRGGQKSSDIGEGKSVKGTLDAFWKGLSGKEKTTSSELVARTAALDDKDNAFDNKKIQALAGFGGDVVKDPLSYVGVGVAKNIAKAPSKVVKDIKKAKELEKTSEEIAQLKIPRSVIHKDREGTLSAQEVHDILGGNLDVARTVGERSRNISQVQSSVNKLQSAVKKAQSAPVGSSKVVKAGDITSDAYKFRSRLDLDVDEDASKVYTEAVEAATGRSQDDLIRSVDLPTLTSAVKADNTARWRADKGDDAYKSYRQSQVNAGKPFLTRAKWNTEKGDPNELLGWQDHPHLGDKERQNLIKDTRDDLYKNDKEYRHLSNEAARLRTEVDTAQAELDRLQTLHAKVDPRREGSKESSNLASGEKTLPQQIEEVKGRLNEAKRSRKEVVDKRDEIHGVGLKQAVDRVSKQNQTPVPLKKDPHVFSLDPERGRYLEEVRETAKKRRSDESARGTVQHSEDIARDADPKELAKNADESDINLGGPGDNIDELLRGQNPDRVIAAANKELENLHSPVGKIIRDRGEVPTAVSKTDGSLDRDKLDDFIQLVHDKGHEPRWVKLTNKIGKTDDPALQDFAKSVVELANRAGAKLTGEAKKTAIHEEMGRILDNLDNVSTLPETSLTWSSKKTKEVHKALSTENKAQFAADIKKATNASEIKEAKLSFGVRQETLDRAKSQASVVKEDLVKKVHDDSALTLLMDSKVNADAVGLVLKTWGNKQAVIPGTKHLFRAGQIANSTPMMNAISDIYYKTMKATTGSGTLFRDFANTAPEIQLARARAESATSIITSHHITKLNNTLAKFPKKQRIDAYRRAMNGDKDSSNQLLTYVNEQLDEMAPYFNGSIKVGDSPLTPDDIHKFMPEAFNIGAGTRGRLFGMSDKEVRESLGHAFGTGFKADKKRIQDPLDVIWHTRIAIEQAMARKSLNYTLNEAFGVEDIGDAFSEMKTLKKNGWKKLEALGNNHYYPPEVHRDIDRLLTMLEPKNSWLFNRGMDRITGYWKMLATIYNPGYYTRNLIGEVMTGWLGGVTNPKWYGKSAKAIKYMKGEGENIAALRQHDAFNNHLKSDIPDGTSVVTTAPDGTPVTYQDLVVLYQDTGLKTGFLRTTYNETAQNKVHSRSSKVLSAPVKGHEALQRAGELGEDFPRMAHFIHGINNAPKGSSVAEAAQYAAEQVRKYHFDYSDVTRFEQTILLRAFPFYKWTRKAMPLMVSMLFAKPGKVNAYPKAMTAISDMSGDSDSLIEGHKEGFMPNYTGVVPDWLREAGAYPLGTDAEGKGTFLNINTPQTDALAAVTNPTKAAGLMLNPFVKEGIQQGVGHKLKNNNDPDGFSNNAERLEAASANLPSTKLLEKILNRKDSPVGEKGAPMDESMLSFISGLNFNEDPGFAKQQKEFEAVDKEYDNNNQKFWKKYLKYVNSDGSFNYIKYANDQEKNNFNGFSKDY